MTFGHGAQSYEERQAVGINIGEELFVHWAHNKGWSVHRIGFDEKDGNVPGFYSLNQWLRNLPDFVIERDGKTFVVAVKGTNKLKETERRLMLGMEKIYSSDRAPLVYAFCLRQNSGSVRFARVSDVMAMYDMSFDQQWPDGKVYRALDLSMLRSS